MTFATGFNTATDGKKFIGAQAVVDNTGTCDIIFPQASVGMYLTGAVTVFDSPSGAIWTIYINSVPIDLTAGAQSGSGLQIGPNDILEVKATNLSAHQGVTYHATFNAIESPANNTPLLVPGHDSLTLPVSYDSTTLLTAVTIPGNGLGTAGTTIGGINATTRFLTCYWTSTSLIDTSVVITGGNSGIFYDTVPFIETAGPITNPQGGKFYAYIENAFDSFVTIDFPQLNTGQSLKLWVVGAPISPLAHIDDGQILPVQTFPGAPTASATQVNTATANVGVLLLSGPTNFNVNFVNNLTIFNVAVAGVVDCSLSGTVSGQAWARAILAAAGAVGSIVTIPINIGIGEPLQAVSSANGQVNYSINYIPMLAT